MPDRREHLRLHLGSNDFNFYHKKQTFTHYYPITI